MHNKCRVTRNADNQGSARVVRTASLGDLNNSNMQTLDDFVDIQKRSEIYIPVVSEQITNTYQTFHYADVTGASADRYPFTVDNFQFNFDRGFVMLRAGFITGNSCFVIISGASSGNFQSTIQINNVIQSEATLTFDSSLGVGLKKSTVAVEPGLIEFVSGDILNVEFIENGTMNWNNVLGYFEVRYQIDSGLLI